jgi:hypothetical protein
MHKLGVVIPYRDRLEQLDLFKKSMKHYLHAKGIPFEIIIVEQDWAKIFNRGKLLNIGYKVASSLLCDYVVFHDIDMIPLDVDYSYEEAPIHLATQRLDFDEYFGGVTLFPSQLFEKINGYSNEYWGWGFEDDDLLHRCKVNNIPLDTKTIGITSGYTSAIKFNGIDSYSKTPYEIKSDKLTVSVTFEPQEMLYDFEAYDDEYTILALSQLDLRISYDSYQRYKVVLKDVDDEIVHITTKKSFPYKTNLTITIDRVEKELSLYQDGDYVGTVKLKSDFCDKRERSLYLGCENLRTKRFFKGTLYSTAVFNRVLLPEEILAVSQNKYHSLLQDFGEYKSADNLEIYYDTKFIRQYKLVNLVNSELGYMTKCEIIPCTFEDRTTISIPYRKASEFKIMNHEENGYVNGGWKSVVTRYNQLRFNNEVMRGHTDIANDGLNNLKYKEFTRVRTGNETHLVVGI